MYHVHYVKGLLYFKGFHYIKDLDYVKGWHNITLYDLNTDDHKCLHYVKGLNIDLDYVKG